MFELDHIVLLRFADVHQYFGLGLVVEETRFYPVLLEKGALEVLFEVFDVLADFSFDWDLYR